MAALALPSPLRALSDEEKDFTRKLITEVRYFDTARRWLDQLSERRGLTIDSKADIASFRIDILKAEGKDAEMRAAMEAFKREFPQHSRADQGAIEVITSIEFPKTVQALEGSRVEVDRTKAAALVSQATKQFDERVRQPLERLIDSLRREVDADPKNDEKLTLLTQAELMRVITTSAFARLIPRESAERKKRLEDGLALAEKFVEERGRYFVMQYEAQIHRGLFLLELGRYEEAEDNLSLLYDATPGSDPPWPEDLLSAYRRIRLQANLFGAQALNQLKEYRRAYRTLETYVLKPRKDIDLSHAEEDSALQQFAVQARLEYAIALAGAGNVRNGLDEIQKVIARYEKDDSPKAQAYVIDARRALGRIAASGDVELAGRDYYQAAVGLKSELRFAEALEALQSALVSLRESELAAWAPRCLNEMGEVCFYLERYEEAALAYLEICNYYSSSPLVSKAAQNLLAMVTNKLSGPEVAEHAGLKVLRERATEYSKKYTSNDQIYRAMVSQAQVLERQGRFAEAEATYLKVPRQVKGEKITFYWRAQASARAARVSEWEAAEGEAREKLAPRIAEIAKELPTIRDSALGEKDLSGAAVASLALGRIHFQRQEWREAVEALDIFTSRLSEDQTNRCPALGYLALSLVRLEDGERAAKLYEELSKACQEEVGTATVAYALARFYADDDEKKAALYMSDYARHPTSAKELEQLDRVLEVVSFLIDGGMVSEAQRYMDRAKRLNADDPDLPRRMLYMDAKILMTNREYGAAIKKLREYHATYRADGSHQEDPYVWRMIATCYLRAGKKNGKIATKYLQKADENYGRAVGILLRGIDRDPVLAEMCWRWAYTWLRIKEELGKKGDKEAYGVIHLFLDGNFHRYAGGDVLKEKLEALWRRAKAKLDLEGKEAARS